jgi:hypothetical protein
MPRCIVAMQCHGSADRMTPNRIDETKFLFCDDLRGSPQTLQRDIVSSTLANQHCNGAILMIRHFAGPLSLSLLTIMLPIAGCQQTQDLEGTGPAASTGTDGDAGAGASEMGSTDGGATKNADASAFRDSGASTSAGKLVLFGGQDANGFLGDTWTWDGTSWTKNTVTSAPSARAFSTGAALGGSAVLFGGEDSTGDVADTWAWNGTAWSQLKVTGPAAAHGVVASTVGSDMVLFGVTGDDDLPQTWSFNGSAWTQNNPNDAPTVADDWVSTTFGGQMLLVASGGYYSWNGTDWTEHAIGSGGPSEGGGAGIATLGSNVVLFGGAGENFNSLAETWTFDGTNWTLQNAKGPSARTNPGMATMKNGTVVLFGGCTYGFEGTADATVCSDDSTWTWDGSTWTEHAVPGPSPRAPALMVAY